MAATAARVVVVAGAASGCGGEGGGERIQGSASNNSPPQYVTKLREFALLSHRLLLAATVQEEPVHEGHDTQLEHVLPPV